MESDVKMETATKKMRYYEGLASLPVALGTGCIGLAIVVTLISLGIEGGLPQPYELIVACIGIIGILGFITGIAMVGVADRLRQLEERVNALSPQE